MERNEKGQFIKGRIETTEEKIRRSAALREEWKTRDGYIGDLIVKHPRVYNSWRGIRFTEKGKAIGCSNEWKDFKVFYNDVIGTYFIGSVFRRLDVSKPFAKDNFIWVTPDTARNMATGKTIQIEYNGEIHTIRDWADKLNVSVNAIRNRYFKHKNDYSIEEILYGRKKKRGSKIPKDISDTKVSIRQKASKMISSYRNKDIKNGTTICDIDVDWMVENILTKPCTYCGDTKRIGCDRINNNLGHTKDNVVPCCIECNTARNNYFTYEEMHELGKTIQKIKNARKII